MFVYAKNATFRNFYYYHEQLLNFGEIRLKVDYKYY